MKRLFLVCCLISLAGCAGGGLDLKGISEKLISDSQRMTPEHAQNIKTAGVISFIEPQPRVHFVSSSLKDSNIEAANLADWDANAIITDLMNKRLKQRGFTVVDIDPGMAIKEAYSSSQSFAEPARIRARLLDIGRAHNVDMLVIVYRQQVRDFVGRSSQKIISYGLYKRHTDPEVFAYSVVHIEGLNIAKGYVLGNSNGEVKTELGRAAWQDKFESEAGPFRIQQGREEVIESLINSVLIAAQEAGLSN